MSEALRIPVFGRRKAAGIAGFVSLPLFLLFMSVSTSAGPLMASVATAADTGTAAAGIKAPVPDRIFVVYGTAESREDFRPYATQLSRLKPFGRVDVSINCPALKALHELPEGSCDWHEYASYNRSVSAFFPDSRISPFIPPDYVAANRQMLLYRAGILKELGLSAVFMSNEPRYLPGAFFEKYPELMGPRVDHPRRSVKKEFAPCMHQQGTIDMYHNMTKQLFTAVPGITTLYFSMNDAGSGSCWCDWLYSGPNGPSACRETYKSEGIVRMLSIYKEEALKNTGHDVDVYFKGMLTDAEKDDLVKKLPPGCFLETRNTPPVRNISTLLDATYPVRGTMDPVRIIRAMGRNTGSPDRIILDLSAIYSRAHEREATTGKVIDILVYLLEDPARVLDEHATLMHFCREWAGDDNAESLYNTLLMLNAALEKHRPSMAGLSTLYWGVSERQITRPLVFAPELLSKDEEKYFLPSVFNVSKDEARKDYTDIHGGHRVLPPNAADSLVSDLKTVCRQLGAIKNAPAQKFISDLERSFRLYCCVLKSCTNFNDAQVLRDKNKEVFSGAPHVKQKEATWTGDKDLLAFNAIMRDELDNTLEMIGLLNDGGMDLICTAQLPFREDTFILGPDLINQLKSKRKIMLAHWTDIENYLVTPLK